MKASALLKNPPVLKQFANYWTLLDQPLGGKEWSLEEKIRQVKKTGFDAISVWGNPEVLALCQKHDLECIFAFDANAQNYREKLDAAPAYQPVRINIQMCDHDTPPKEAVRVWLKIEAYAKKLGLKNLDLEVHRDTCTETPEKVQEIAALYKKATGREIQYCWDFSHFAIVKHINPPYADRLITPQVKLVQKARQFHLRPFNGHHCQVPVTDGKGHDSPEIKPYLAFIDALFTCWLKGAKGGECIYVCPELGPLSSGYGLKGFPDVWKDATILRQKTAAIWKKNLLQWKTGK